MNHIERGQAGEEAAWCHLEALGYQLLERNFRGKTGELDIVAMDGETVVFVEVKLRRLRTAALEAVDFRKQRRVARVAVEYLQKHGWLDREARFDVVAVDRETLVCSHFADAFEVAGAG